MKITEGKDYNCWILFKEELIPVQIKYTEGEEYPELYSEDGSTLLHEYYRRGAPWERADSREELRGKLLEHYNRCIENCERNIKRFKVAGKGH